MTASVRLQANVAAHRERRTAQLYAMSRELAATRGQEAMARVAVRHVSEVFDSQVVILLPGAGGRLRHPRGDSISGSLHGADLAVAEWVHGHGEPAGQGTHTLPASEALYLPLKGSQCRASACSAYCRPTRGACCCPSNSTCSRPSPARSRWRWSAPSSPNTRSARRSAPRPRACATRCSPRSRTTCARRWP